MTTTTSSSEKNGFFPGALFRRLLRRNLPTGLYFCAAVFFFLTLPYLTEIFSNVPVLVQGEQVGRSPSLMDGAEIYTGFSIVTFYLLMMAAPVVITLSQMSWLHSRRAVDLYHSLPVGRPGLLLAHAGAAHLTVALPVALNFLVMAAAGAARLGMIASPKDTFTLPVREILLEYLGWMTVELAIIAVILLVATQVGSVFENFAFSAELLCAPALIILLTNYICGEKLSGYWAGYLDYQTLAYSTPVSLMAGRYVAQSNGTGSGAGAILLWLVLGLLILGAAVVLYMRRPSELAETSGAREPLNSLGRLAAVYLGGLALGEFFIFITGADHLVLWTLAGAVLVAVLAQAVLNRGFRDMPRALPSMAAQVLLTVLAPVIITTGGLGYASRVPTVEQAESATISYRGFYGELAQHLDLSSGWTYTDSEGELRYRYSGESTVTLTSPEAVQAVLDIHRSFVQTGTVGSGGNRLSLAYGNGMRRSYNFRNRDPALFLALEENREFLEKTNPLYTLGAEEVLSVRLSDATGLVASEPITGDQAARILEAARADADAFDFGTLMDGSARVALYLTVDTAGPGYGEGLEEVLEEGYWFDFCLPVFASDRNTLAMVKELGLGDLLEDHTGLVVGLQAESAPTSAGWYGGAALAWPTNTPPIHPEGSSDTARWVQENLDGGWLIGDPGELETLLNQGLGRGYYVEQSKDVDQEEQGFILTIYGVNRQGASFWIPKEAATASIREEYSYLWEG
jgi:hypothetical protein